MNDFQYDFLRFSVEQNILQFGNFTLKSGRSSPFFFNIGHFCSGQALASVGEFLARAMVESGIVCDMLFGPAYKGIPLVTATAIALSRNHHQDYCWCFNRKEAKAHGEMGDLVGAPLAGRVTIVDDVITAGTSARASAVRIRQAQALPVCTLVCLDRQERGEGQQSAAQQLQDDHENMSIISIANLTQLLAFVQDNRQLAQHSAAMTDYIQGYGCA
ncbi:MAG: orotate phosphoribosyltransferase [Kistimonas sp.]|nr:orotate phosphoribosyltransferase [Kistimonas sp.]